jgi:hypothetical protein
LIPKRVSLHSFQQVSGKAHFDKSFVGGPYLRRYMRAFPVLKTGNSLSASRIHWFEAIATLVTSLHESHFRILVQPLQVTHHNAARIRRKEREKKRHISKKIKFVSVIEIECTFVFMSSPLQNEPDFLLPRLAPTCHVVCHTNVRAVKDALDFQG